MTKYQHRRWRTGRKVGRTIYAQLGFEPSDDDVMIAVAVGDDRTAREIATRIVADHNRAIVP